MKRKIHDLVSENLIGKEIILQGLAFDSKAGAVLKLRNDMIVYIYDLASWPSEFIGQKTCVTGTFQKKKIIPDVKIDEDGAISQGAPGDQLLLENVKEIKKII